MPSDTAYETRDVQHFEHWSHSYERSWMQDRLFSRVHSAVLAIASPLPVPATVLDVGCGTGRLLRAAGASSFVAKVECDSLDHVVPGARSDDTRMG